MKDVVKEFTVIDLLGILPAGILLILLLSYDWNDYTLWQGYFGETCGEATKVTILLVSGYFVGMLLHELGDWLEKLLFCIRAIDPRWRAAKKVGQEKLMEKLPKQEGDDQDKALYQWIKTHTPDILTAAAKDGPNEKLRLFDGFHVAMRNLLVTMIILIIYLLVTRFATPLGKAAGAVFGTWCGKAVGLAVFILCGVRGYHYIYLKYKYAYENYLLSQSAER